MAKLQTAREKLKKKRPATAPMSSAWACAGPGPPTYHKVKRINHQEAYSDGDAFTNQAESFFSRLRRAEIGVYHHIAGPYLEFYARELAWREDTRRIPNGEQFLLVILASLDHGKLPQWRVLGQVEGETQAQATAE